MVDVTDDAMAEEQFEIHRVIQRHGPTPDATCLGWTLVAEFEGEDGRRFLGRYVFDGDTLLDHDLALL